MSDFSVRSENVDVEQIMRQIRSRIREKRGVDYTEEEIRELANVKLEKFIDPKGVRSGLLEEYRRVTTAEPPAPNFAFGEDTLYETHRGPIRWLRSLFRPFLKLLFNPNPLIQALHIQADLNTRNAERGARRDALHYEVIHNLVVELTRTGVEVKALKMRLESMASRLDFDERRARALEGVVQYRAGAVPPQQPPASHDQGRRDQGQRDQRSQQGRPDQGRRDQRPQDQGRREQAPQDQWQRPAVPGPSVAGSSAPGSPVAGSPVAGSPVAGSSVPGSSVPGAPVEANALDADGNERRARRRRRRGRRRPDGRPMPDGRESISDNRYPISDVSNGSDSRDGAEAGPVSGTNDPTAATSESIGHPTSDIGHRTQASDTTRLSAPATPSGSEPPTE